ncbi:ImmA/IrrE family metallo-endopeptidase [Cohnella sp. GCM10020058]|uniref:ImmA/IrrE family metallo-endopeptidase n=1 Tax=Cohnella sp. GCM10020058 TaxID=3317330 RepID=UPI0036294B58
MYEELLIEAHALGVEVYEVRMKGRDHGLYSDFIIWIDKRLKSVVKMTCVLAEEIGHHHKTVGDITDQTILLNRKQEKHARTWGYLRLIPLSAFISAHRAGVRNRFELAQFLGVTEKFVDDTITRYQELYGLHAIHDGHLIMFDPLMVVDPIDL